MTQKAKKKHRISGALGKSWLASYQWHFWACCLLIPGSLCRVTSQGYLIHSVLPSLMHAFFHVDHITGVFCFRLTWMTWILLLVQNWAIGLLIFWFIYFHQWGGSTKGHLQHMMGKPKRPVFKKGSYIPACVQQMPPPTLKKFACAILVCTFPF